MPFDTHRFVNRLTEVRMPAGQADEQAALFDTRLATRQDVVPLKQDVSRPESRALHGEVDRLRHRFRYACAGAQDVPGNLTSGILAQEDDT